jgi:hypothetical protein
MGIDGGCGGVFIIDESVIFHQLSPVVLGFDRDAAAFGDMLAYLQKAATSVRRETAAAIPPP